MSRTHELKCWPSFFAAVLDGSKTFEVRQNDRDFSVGDVLHLREWDPSPDVAPPERPRGDGIHVRYTRRDCLRVVTYVLRGGEFGIAPGHCVLGLALPDATQAEAPTSALESSIRALDDAHVAEVEKARREGRDAGLREVREALRQEAVNPADADDYEGLMAGVVLIDGLLRTSPSPAPDVASLHAELAKLRAVAEAAARLQRWRETDHGKNSEGVAVTSRLIGALDAALPNWRTAP